MTSGAEGKVKSSHIGTEESSWRSILPRMWCMLTPIERRRSYLILIAVLLNSAVEILGLAAIVPVIALATTPELLETDSIFRSFYDITCRFYPLETNEFILVTCVFLILAFTIKSVVQIIIGYITSRFSYSVAHRISGEVWRHHFNNNLQRIRSQESGQILTEINTWPLGVAQTFILGNIRLINEILVIAIISFGLLLYSPSILCGLITILAIGTSIIRLVTQRKLKLYSLELQSLTPRSLSIINNAIRGVIEIMTFRAEKTVRNIYLANTRRIYNVSSNSTVIQLLPGKLYEMLAVIAVSGTIILTVLSQTENAELLELVTILALSTYRVMPSMMRINTQVMGMSNYYHLFKVTETSLQSLRNSDKLVSEQGDTPTIFKCNLNVEWLEADYGNPKNPVLKAVNFCFKHSTIQVITGESGSGKSTLVNCILDLHRNKTGQISISGLAELESASVHQSECTQLNWLNHFAYVSQDPFFFAGTIKQNLNFDGAITFDETQALRLFKDLNLSSALGEEPFSFTLNENASNLSGGQKQRLALVRALVQQKPILILDEATSALDVINKEIVLQHLHDKTMNGCNVILITHDPSIINVVESRLHLESQT